MKITTHEIPITDIKETLVESSIEKVDIEIQFYTFEGDYEWYITYDIDTYDRDHAGEWKGKNDQPFMPLPLGNYPERNLSVINDEDHLFGTNHNILFAPIDPALPWSLPPISRSTGDFWVSAQIWRKDTIIPSSTKEEIYNLNRTMIENSELIGYTNQNYDRYQINTHIDHVFYGVKNDDGTITNEEILTGGENIYRIKFKDFSEDKTEFRNDYLTDKIYFKYIDNGKAETIQVSQSLEELKDNFFREHPNYYWKDNEGHFHCYAHEEVNGVYTIYE